MVGKIVKLRNFLSWLLNRQLAGWGYAFVRTRDSHASIKYTVEHLGKVYAYQNVTIPDIYSPWAVDKEFLAIWTEAQSNSLVDIYRCYELYQLVREVANLPGDILEVGVWRGGTAAVLAAAMRRWKPEAKIWLCDTFSGVVKAGEYDPAYSGGEHGDTSVNLVSSLFTRLGLTNAHILPGVFPEDTAGAIESTPIALCHVDVDVYQSASDIVTWVTSRMMRGAILVFDDYGFSSCKGITQCVEELRATGNWLYIYNMNKHAVLIRR